ncbi:MAG: lysophospholipid acyltransferase family protein [Rhodothermales bacterium]|nr:lysophospholipid acyltransferase family protein [Rhodothermales bacterium]
MRRYWRAVRVVWILISHTAVTSLGVRFRPQEGRAAYRARRQQRGVRRVCRALGVRVAREGTPPQAPMLAVCNHLGVLDPIVLASQVPIAFAGKAELRRWPLVGWVCRTHGMLFVHRTRVTQTETFVAQVRRKLEAGVTVLVFPEGTTSRGVSVRRFKTGAFEAVAGMDGGAVLPLALAVEAVEGDPSRREEATWADNGQTFVEHALSLAALRRLDFRVRVGAPIPTAGRDRKVLAREAHAAVCTLAGLPAGPPAILPASA